MQAFFSGVIEGFYGKQWSWQSRRDYADFLKSKAYDCYIYAPKGDAYLRSRWREPWPTAEYQQLSALANHYRDKQVEWGMGFSPLELFRSYSVEERPILANKVAEINQINPDILCILFDDMPGDFADLASQQLAIVQDIVSVSTARRFIVCPTYYSFDPVLEAVFGQMPVNYLEVLGAELPADIALFWTGDKVISPELSIDSIKRATDVLGRAPVIWDNLLANDGSKTADFLRYNAMAGRSGDLPRYLAGHLVNPMNQAALSKVPLTALSDIYAGRDDYCFDSLDKHLKKLLLRDDVLFTQHGLGQINSLLRQHLSAEYARIADPAANEVVLWLAGAYRFDPDCLTG